MNTRANLAKAATGLLLALCVAPASAQWREVRSQQPQEVKGEGRWSELRLEVKDVSSGEVIGTVEPEGHIRMREGSKVRLIMSAYVPGNNKAIYPETTYAEAQRGRGGVTITKASRENANVTLQLVNIKEAYGQRSERVSYEILDARVPRRQQHGAFVIDVISNEAADSPRGEGSHSGRPGYDRPSGGRPSGGSLTRQEEMTRVLYRAILMREPDPGAQGFTDQIVRDGYAGVIRVAVTIAESNESRIQVYEKDRDLTPEVRLQTLYRELLGMNEGQYDRRTWDDDLRQIRDGRIAPVVDEMVRSQRFRERYSY